MTDADTDTETRPLKGAVAGQRAAAQAIGRSKNLITKWTADRRLHPFLVQGAGMRHCYAVDELSAHVSDHKLHPVPIKSYFPDAKLYTQPSEDKRGPAQAVEGAPQLHSESPPIRPSDDEDAPAVEASATDAPAGDTQQDLEAAEIVLVQTVTGADSVVREKIAHIGDLESAFEFAIHEPGRYAVKRVDSTRGVPELLRHIDTSDAPAAQPAPVHDSPNPTPPHPGYQQPPGGAAQPGTALAVAPPPTPADRMMELLLSFFLKQAGDVSSQMNPAKTAAELVGMWHEGKETGAQEADAITGPAQGDTNAWDFLVVLVEHVGPNVGEQLGNLLALAMMRAGNNGDERQGQQHTADAREAHEPVADELASR